MFGATEEEGRLRLPPAEGSRLYLSSPGTRRSSAGGSARIHPSESPRLFGVNPLKSPPCFCAPPPSPREPRPHYSRLHATEVDHTPETLSISASAVGNFPPTTMSGYDPAAGNADVRKRQRVGVAAALLWLPAAAWRLQGHRWRSDGRRQRGGGLKSIKGNPGADGCVFESPVGSFGHRGEKRLPG